MDLSFFTMPIHPVGKPIAQSMKEDREAFLLADRLGYVEGYCGEHTTDLAEVITSTVAFMASLAYETKTSGWEPARSTCPIPIRRGLLLKWPCSTTCWKAG